MPALAVEPNVPMPFQKLLRSTNIVFPLLPEVDAINDPVGRIVTEVRVQELNQWLQFLSSERAFCEDESDCI